eukprot:750308-Hanusia_phi.AAC.2
MTDSSPSLPPCLFFTLQFTNLAAVCRNMDHRSLPVVSLLENQNDQRFYRYHSLVLGQEAASLPVPLLELADRVRHARRHLLPNY